MKRHGGFDGAKFAAALRTYRKQQRNPKTGKRPMTQPQLAALSGLTKGTILRLENPNNVEMPDHETVIALIDALQAPRDEFLGPLGYSVTPPSDEAAINAASVVVDKLPLPPGQRELIESVLQMARDALPSSTSNEQ